MTSPDARPTAAPAAHDARAALDRQLAAAETRAQQAGTDFATEIEQAVSAPLAALAANALRAHADARQVLEGSGFGEADVDAYRLAVRERVILPLRAGLDALGPSRVVHAAATAAFGALAPPPDVPAVLRVPEPSDLLDPDPSDSARLRLRRSRERSRRAWADRARRAANQGRRLVRRAERPATVRFQDVPLGALLAFHHQVRLASPLVTEHARLQQEAADVVGRLVRACGAWTYTALGRPEPGRLRPAADELDAAIREAMQGAEALRPALFAGSMPRAHESLLTDVAQSGALGLLPEQPLPAEGDAPVARIAAAAARWRQWHQRARRRLDLRAVQLHLESVLLRETGAVHEAVRASGPAALRQTMEETTEGFLALRQEAAETCDTCADPAALSEPLSRLLARALALSAEALHRLQEAAPGAAAEQEARAAQRRLRDETAALPERLEVTADPPFSPPNAEADTFLLEPRGTARAAFSDDFFSDLARSADSLRQPLFRLLAQAEELDAAVRYNLEAALDELAADEASPAERIARARELTVDGLDRAAARAAELSGALDAPFAAFIDKLTALTRTRQTTLHNRLGASGALGRQLADARSQAGAAMRRAQVRADRLTKGVRRQSARLLRRGRQGAGELLRRGQTVAGLAAASAAQERRTLDALAQAPRLLAGLPLVYRRLFSPSALNDPLLLEGRDAELARVADAYAAWQQGVVARALVLSAPHGAGATSLLNAVARTVTTDYEAEHVTLSARFDAPLGFARFLSDSLGLQLELSRSDPFGPVERALLKGPRRVVFVEHAEHLLLRAPGGLDLIERVAILMSRTDRHVLWIATVSADAWHYVGRTAPQVRALVDTVTVGLLGREALEAAVLRRHARSGLPLRYLAPDNPSAVLRQRLRSAKTEPDQTALLQADFFDRLHRTTGGHFPLALLYWLRSADFASDADVLTVRPLEALDFSFLDRFDMQRAFALKALLLHGTLTLAEHGRIVRSSADESVLAFEALSNQLLLERADDEDEPSPTIEPGVRYRLPARVAYPASQALRARNVL